MSAQGPGYSMGQPCSSSGIGQPIAEDDQPLDLSEGPLTETLRPQVSQIDIDALQRLERLLLDRGPPASPERPVANPGSLLSGGLNLSRHFSRAGEWSSMLELVATAQVRPPVEATSFAGIREFPRRLGFDPEELVRSGALECHPCRPNDLVNPIHKLFRFSNFTNCDAGIYEALKPALRLASLWISHPSCRSFFTTVMFGQRTIDMERTLESKKLQVRVERHHMKESDEWIYDQHWDVVASNISFTFHASLWDNDCYGYCSAPSITDTFRAPVFPTVDPWRMPTRISLLKDFYTQAGKFAALKHPDEAARLRFYFFAAVNICHELAHAVEFKGSSAYFCSLRHSLGTPQFVKLMQNEHFAWVPGFETIFEDTQPQKPEMGEQWEHDFFGGRVGPINSRADGLYGMNVCNQITPEGAFVHVFYSIPMGYIEEIQQQAYWETLVPRQRTTGFFRVPKIGASAIGAHSFSPVHLRDYLLYKEAEELGLEDVDRFVDKRHTLGEETTGPADDLRQAEVREAKEAVAARYRELVRNIPERTSHPVSGDSDSDKRTGPADQSHDMDVGLKSSTGSSSETSDGSLIDVATKEPATMTPADKWRLTEEYFCLTHNYDSLAFLSLRAAKRIILPDVMNPWIANSWQRPMLDILRRSREHNGTAIIALTSLPDPNDEQLAQVAQKWLWVEELMVYRGRFRREAYAARAGWTRDVFSNNDLHWQPRNSFSWLEREQNILHEERQKFNEKARKWALLEEYMLLKSVVTTRDDFLRHKHTGRISFEGDNAKMDPDNPESWGEEQMELLKHIRYELSAARKNQKWEYVRDTWALSGRSPEELQSMLSEASVRKAFFDRYARWDPDRYDSWNKEEVEKLKQKVALTFQQTGRAPIQGNMVFVSRLDASYKLDFAPSYATATSRQKKEHEQHEKWREEKEGREAKADVKKPTYSTADLAQRLVAKVDAEGAMGPDLSSNPSFETPLEARLRSP